MNTIRWTTALTIAAALVAAPLSAQVKSSGPKTAPRPKTSVPRAAPAKLLAPESVFVKLSQLNNEERFVAPLFGKVQLKDLQQANCLGVKLPQGRVLIESSGGNYGLEFTRDKEPRMTAIGLVWVEGAVRIGGKSVKPGPYLVFASETALGLLTEERAPNAGPSSGTSVTLPLRAPLPSAQLDRKSTERPRVTVSVESGKAHLQVGENKFAITP